MLKLSPPWFIYCKKVEALFAEDPEVRVAFNEATTTLSLYVENPVKAEAIQMLLPVEKDFGNVKLLIKVIPANLNTNDVSALLKSAFKGNTAVNDVIGIDTPMSGHQTFVVFKPEVVQIYNDDLMELYGEESTLYQSIAKEVFNEFADVNYCTDHIQK